MAKKYCELDFQAEEVLQYCRAQVMKYVWELMRRHGEFSPPFLENPEHSEFIKSRMINEIKYGDNIDYHGNLVPNSDGFTLILKNGLSSVRRRNVIAHEIGHTFMYDLDGLPPKPFLPSDFSWKYIEGPAYEIGRHVLVPDAWLIERNHDVSLENFIVLLSLFQVSNDVLARRLIHDLELWDAILIVNPHMVLNTDMKSASSAIFRGRSFRSLKLKQHKEEILEMVRKTDGLSERIMPIGKKKFVVEILKPQSSQSLCLIRRY